MVKWLWLEWLLWFSWLYQPFFFWKFIVTSFLFSLGFFILDLLLLLVVGIIELFEFSQFLGVCFVFFKEFLPLIFKSIILLLLGVYVLLRELPWRHIFEKLQFKFVEQVFVVLN
jgi:hypothetical protein